MDRFSISDLARLSGIKPFTIRTWEKRYKALDPNRSPGNTRFYNNQQLRRLLNITSLMQVGLKASELCALPDAELYSKISSLKLKEQQGIEDFLITQLICAGYSYDEHHFNNTFTQAITRFGLTKAYILIIYPMLERIGILWNADRINAANEHFILNLLRQKILSAIDLLPSPKHHSPTWLLFLPEDEFHETGLLIAHYLIKASGNRSVYLGANTPLQAVQTAAAVIRPDNLLFFFVQYLSREIRQPYLDSLASAVKSPRILAAGHALSSDLKPSRRIKFVESADSLVRILNEIPRSK